MTDQPEPLLDIHKLRADDVALDRAARGTVDSNDRLLRMIQAWGQECQAGTSLPRPTGY